jgi:Family of unknown function (DUF6236)
LPDIALYYPNIWMRDEAWVKAALLYWPRIARMVPDEWGGGEEWARDSEPPGPWRGCWPPEVYFRLSERDPGFLRDIDISSVTEEPAEQFARVIETHADELGETYGIAALIGEFPSRGFLPDESAQDLPLEWVHSAKVTWRLTEALIDARLAVSCRQWLGMHPKLAWVYMCALADRLARKNQMPAVTDEPHVCTALNGWGMGTLVSALLDDGAAVSQGPRDQEEVGRLFTLLAFRIILPEGLAGIPFDRILDAREVLMPSMYAYRRYLDGLAEQFSTLAAVEDPRALNEHLDIMVRGEIEPRLVELQSRMRGLGFRPIGAVLGMKSLAPSVLVAAAAHEAGLPTAVTATGAVAACLVGAALDARQQAKVAAAESPVSYLLDLKHQLSPGEVVSRSRARLLGRP